MNKNLVLAVAKRDLRSWFGNPAGYVFILLFVVLSTIALVFIAAYGGHEFKWKEVAILSVVLVIFSVLVFVKGLTLPFPICPSIIDNCPIR